MKNKLLLLSLAVFTIIGCKKEEPKKPGAMPFPVVSVETKNVTGYETYPASIQGIVNNDVRAKIQGYVTQVLVDEGQFVTQGQPLFRLETNSLSQSANAAKLAGSVDNINNNLYFSIKLLRAYLQFRLKLAKGI